MTIFISETYINKNSSKGNYNPEVFIILEVYTDYCYSINRYISIGFILINAHINLSLLNLILSNILMKEMLFNANQASNLFSYYL